MRCLIILAIPAALAACSSETKVTATNSSVEAVAKEVAASGATVALTPGRWENSVTTTVAMPAGMPQQPPQVQNIATCLTAEDVKSNNNPFAQQLGKNCKYDKFTMQDGKIDATATCNVQGMTTNSTVSGTFTPETVKMTSSAEVGGAGAGPMSGMKMDMAIDAKHTGACRGDEGKSPAAPTAG